jgi:hypothetical protein
MKKKILIPALILMFASVITFTSCKDAAPVITITGGNTQSQALPSTAGAGTWTNPSATATDDVDGNLSSGITVTGTVDPNTAGTYVLTYSVTDKSGNSNSEIVTVTIFNSADILERTYSSCHDSCQVTAPFNYTVVVTASNTVNGEFVISNFGGFGTSANVNASMSGSVIIVPASQALVSSSYLIACNGTITSTSPSKFNLTYTWTDGSSNEVCSSVCQ